MTVYWIAHEYADLLGSHIAGRLPAWRDIRGALTASWTMVSASYLPLICCSRPPRPAPPPLTRPAPEPARPRLRADLYALAAGRAPRSVAAANLIAASAACSAPV
jgi:hypothetical protein